MLAIDHVSWRPPRALAAAGATAPAVLTYKTDNFMEELAATLADEPAFVAQRTARPETWRDDSPEPLGFPGDPGPDLHPYTKLYQPAHGRFYLLSAHLVCRRYGYPDRKLGPDESAGFVVRRVRLDNPSREYAWQPQGLGGTWVEIVAGNERARVGGEEFLPMHPTSYEVSGRGTRLLTGLLPVSAREKYEAAAFAGTASTAPDASLEDDDLADLYATLLLQMVAEPIWAIGVSGFGISPPVSESEAKEAIALALVDLVGWLDARSVSIGAAASALQVPVPVTPTWSELLTEIATHKQAIMTNTAASGVDPDLIPALPVLDSLIAAEGNARNAAVALFGGTEAVSTAAYTVLAGLGTSPELPEGYGPVVQDDPIDGGLYVFRCVYERTDCLHERTSWVSDRTEPFRLASFFDPDAPTRPVNISLPFDTSPGGLRKFPRNVNVMLSKQLRAQMGRVKGLDDIDGPQAPGLGMLCSMSIPIITICALILLMILVSLLNIVFRWMPFFKVCRPVQS